AGPPLLGARKILPPPSSARKDQYTDVSSTMRSRARTVSTSLTTSSGVPPPRPTRTMELKPQPYRKSESAVTGRKSLANKVPVEGQEDATAPSGGGLAAGASGGETAIGASPGGPATDASTPLPSGPSGTMAPVGLSDGGPTDASDEGPPASP